MDLAVGKKGANIMKLCIIQARMSSTRLRGKVLFGIDSKPMLLYMVERVRAAKKIDQLIIATSTDISDNLIEEFCNDNKISCYRGSLEDVLDRYYQAAVIFEASIIIRLTADCPLIDPVMIDAVVGAYIDSDCDYAANAMPPPSTVPDGMDVEVFSFRALARAWRESEKPSDREHVTFYFWKNPQYFNLLKYNLKQDFSKYRLTVDYKEDFEVIASVFKALYPPNNLFSLYDIIAFLNQNPAVFKVNSMYKPNQGWVPSYKKDKRFGF